MVDMPRFQQWSDGDRGPIEMVEDCRRCQQWGNSTIGVQGQR